MSPPVRNGLVWLLLMAIPLVVLVGHTRYFNFVNDDAFISFRYADNLVRIGELNFNPGQRVEGYTNFLWTIVVALGLSLGCEVVGWALGVALICSLGTLIVVQRFGMTVDRLVAAGDWPADHKNTAGASWRFVAPALLALASPFACWTSGGLETALFTLLVTAAVWRYWAERIGGAGIPWSGMLFALAAMTRPEGFLFFGLTAVHRLIDNGARGGRWLPARRDWAWLGLFLLPTLPHQVWRISYYGYLFPNTYYAKVSGVDHDWRGLLYLQNFVANCKPWIVLLLLVVPRSASSAPGARASRSLYAHLLVLVLALAVHVVRAGGDFMALHRFFVPVLPLLALMLADGLRNLHALLLALRRQRHAPAFNVFAVEVVLALVVVAHFGWLSRAHTTGGSGGGIDGVPFMNQFARDNAAVGRWLAANADPDATIATTAAGAVPYYSRLRTFDMHGLTEPSIAHGAPPLRSRPGHSRTATTEQVLEWAPTYYVGVPAVYSHKSDGNAAERRRWEPQGYRWRVVPLPDLPGRWWGFFERTEDGATEVRSE